MGSTEIVTDLVKAGFVPAFYSGYVSVTSVCLLDDGIAVLHACAFSLELSST